MIIDNIKADKFKNDVMNLSGPSLLSRAIREVLDFHLTLKKLTSKIQI